MALDQVELITKTKLGYLGSLPYMVAGLAHDIPAVVRKIAATCYHSYDALRPEQRRLLPPHTQDL
eukprot:3033698-Prorocentrum_lima.AAC.1